MKAKLIKDKYVNDFYYLMVGIDTFATTHKESFRILSLKNCQAIERGYDLDKLIEEAIIQVVDKNEQVGLFDIGFLKGFLKALEILGDKKFSEDDVNLAFILGKNRDESRINQLINSKLQQTEWDVEVEMVPALSNNGNAYYGDIPKTDADGCLILKHVV